MHDQVRVDWVVFTTRECALGTFKCRSCSPPSDAKRREKHRKEPSKSPSKRSRLAFAPPCSYFRIACPHPWHQHAAHRPASINKLITIACRHQQHNHASFVCDPCPPVTHDPCPPAAVFKANARIVGNNISPTASYWAMFCFGLAFTPENNNNTGILPVDFLLIHFSQNLALTTRCHKTEA